MASYLPRICRRTVSIIKSNRSILKANFTLKIAANPPVSSLLFNHGASLTTIRFSSYGGRKQVDLYELLKVSKNATAKELKVAYYNEAKKFHPDLNPNDPKAKEQFQKIAAAYELLSDDKRRRVYDTTGFQDSQSARAGAGSAQQQQYTQQNAEEVFRSVQQDVDIIKEAVQSYATEMKDEVQYMMDCVRARDWEGLNESVSANKGLIFGIIVPTILFVRYPPAVFLVLRLLWAFGNIAVAGLLSTGNLELAGRLIWARIVNMSLEQKKRAQERKEKEGK